jgi:adenylyl- and sulfurtransferase ThiI
MLEHVREICRQKVRRTPKDLQSYRGKRRSNPIQKGVTTIYEISVAGKCALFYKKKVQQCCAFYKKEEEENNEFKFTVKRWGTLSSRVVDPDPDWIRIQRLCGSGSGLGIRIQGQEN